jgi:hypothetical protein
MKLTNLQKAADYEVNAWLEEIIPEITDYQKQRIRERELVRFSKFEFYKRRPQEKITFLWRLTFFLLPIYFILLFLGLPIKMLITGKWTYGQKFFDNFHTKWMHKLKL